MAAQSPLPGRRLTTETPASGNAAAAQIPQLRSPQATPLDQPHPRGLIRRHSGDGDGFLITKGIRDVVLALVLGILLVTGHRRALGWVLLVEALAAYGDMTTVRRGGPVPGQHRLHHHTRPPRRRRDARRRPQVSPAGVRADLDQSLTRATH
ncbi:DUF4267 domain-containing protein [Streptomyces sp. CA-288835]|uniref:DUF4267 domain-containing protein n=1 Tax=Streptomyces sp. CA-288835 TaxID=3240069 RepID=UPI003D8B0F62